MHLKKTKISHKSFLLAFAINSFYITLLNHLSLLWGSWSLINSPFNLKYLSFKISSEVELCFLDTEFTLWSRRNKGLDEPSIPSNDSRSSGEALSTLQLRSSGEQMNFVPTQHWGQGCQRSPRLKVLLFLNEVHWRQSAAWEGDKDFVLWIVSYVSFLCIATYNVARPPNF